MKGTIVSMLLRCTPGAGLCLALLATAGPALAATGTVIEVEEWNRPDGSQGITLSTDHARAGKVTFAVRNRSTDEVHELLIVRSDLGADGFPTEADNPARIDEGKLSDVKEVGDLAPGGTARMTLALKPGRYVLFCNQPGHFMAGMHTTLTVTP